MDVISTPTGPVVSTMSSPLVLSPLEILNQVSRLTLAESRTPQTPCHTPYERKRKPSFVTPLCAHDGITRENTPVISKNMIWKRDRENIPPPLLPGSPEMEGNASHNPFRRHKPMHSPATRISNVNLDFFSNFLDDQSEEGFPRCNLPVRTISSPNFFPDLEDERPPKKVLKMRRCQDDVHVSRVAFDFLSIR